MGDSTENKNRQRIHLNEPYENESIKVHFIGDVLLSNQDEIGYHYNPGYEICIITSGKGIFKINDKAYPISTEQIFITKAPQYHGGWPSKDEPFRIQYICFSIKDFKCDGQTTLWEEVNNKLCSISTPISDEKHGIKEIHRRLVREVLEGGEYSEEIIESLLLQFILLSLRNFCKDKSSKEEKGEYSLSKILAQKLIYYIDEHVGDELSLEKISSHFKYSVPYICKCFKRETGFALMEYYNYARLEGAKAEIREGTEAISTIADKYAYGSIHHFSNAFKEVYGVSPTEYRKSIRFCK